MSSSAAEDQMAGRYRDTTAPCRGGVTRPEWTHGSRPDERRMASHQLPALCPLLLSRGIESLAIDWSTVGAPM
jgi:hypothetical protein